MNTIVKLRKLKAPVAQKKVECDNYGRRSYAEFHPHCFVQQLALASAKQFDEMYALAHAPVRGDEEEA